jgi:transcriptional regulator with XRE-family HTH domain
MEVIMLTGEQVRAARAMLDWEQSELAERANISVKTVKRMEATSGHIDARSIYSVKTALERAGIEFLDGDGDWRSRGEGLRFCKDPTVRLRRDLIESLSISIDVSLKMAVDSDEDFFERPIEQIVAKLSEDFRESLAQRLQQTLSREA